MAERIEIKVLSAALLSGCEPTKLRPRCGWMACWRRCIRTFRSGCGLTLPGFGGFYLDRRRESWAFKFNPGQKLRALLAGPPYRGPL